ncbi:Asp/Glu racemase [Kitasatospora aureofaciens]|uniref:Maleate isomerase n=1 Tax=Kitasatospora aureofaciens TaxID=1894 RepID=A0A1E7NCP0_KITAU|nr:Asp/Glu racemase [Kitasatospora aureofaciens]ARF82143.1 Asp/Glu racemase [Kitasatospora aureofaciens]OEV38460.1 Asp/Glu racemase [Kitasatospora aureofaciens]GGU84889.1 maleate isomerase [Kitasatospora aureofaciens]
MTTYRIGQIVPSSNVTMETEVPALLRAREAVAPERFTFHSSRMRMTRVTPEQLRAMDAESDRCAAELSDARVDVIGYACLVAVMATGPGYHREAEQRLHRRTVENGAPAPVVTSAGALVAGLRTLGAKKVAMVTPYLRPLARTVVDYLAQEGIEVLDHAALEIADNLDVAAHDPARLPAIAKGLSHGGADAVVLSACVQMPSLSAVEETEQQLGKPVVSAAICTTHQLLRALGLPAVAPGAGHLLSGAYA